MGAKLSDSDDDSGDISDINVTPFVDVVLVLLVIFMVTAPTMIKEAMNIQLPAAANSDAVAPKTMGIVVTSTGQVVLNGQLSSIEALIIEATRGVKENADLQAVISADQEAKHGDIVKVMDAVKGAGLRRFAFEVRKP